MLKGFLRVPPGRRWDRGFDTPASVALRSLMSWAVEFGFGKEPVTCQPWQPFQGC